MSGAPPKLNQPELNQPAAPIQKNLRLFFALWPNDDVRQALSLTGKWLYKHWGGRRMRADTLHITLAFLGDIPAERLPAVMTCAETIRAEAFELLLDKADYWQHNHIGWLGANQLPAQYITLVKQLHSALTMAELPTDPRPHVPHVTLLRNTLGGKIPACEPVHWSIHDFVLVRSSLGPEGAHYEVIKRWSLA